MRNGIGAKLEKDEAEAIRWHRLAAEQGHEAAAIALNNYLGA
jgi:TPR repeat protein